MNELSIDDFVQVIAAHEAQGRRIIRMEASKKQHEKWAEEMLPKPPSDDEPDDFITRVKWECYGKAMARAKKRCAEIGDTFNLFGIPGTVTEIEDYVVVTVNR